MKTWQCMVLALFSIFTLVSRAPADEITIVADVWCPYNCDQESADQGYMIEIARQVFEKAGHKVVYRNMEWKKAIEETREGACTAVVGAAKSDTPDFVFPERSLGSMQNHFFVKKGTAWKYSGVESLKAVRLGIAQGYTYTDDVDEYIAAGKDAPSIFVATGDTPIQELIDKLMKGEIDTFLEDPSVYGNYCGTKNLMNVLGATQPAGTAGPPDDLYIAFSPANPKSKAYAALLSAGMDQLRKSGGLKTILDKYYMRDWE